jgi:predicted nucleotidyltransferase
LVHFRRDLLAKRNDKMPRPDTTPVQIAAYRATAQLRIAQQRREVRARRARAWKIARAAAALLKQEFGAQCVQLFGSLARGDPLSVHSDVDLAAWGIDGRDYYRIVAQLQDLDPSIAVDLVLMEEVSAAIAQAVEQEGVAL